MSGAAGIPGSEEWTGKVTGEEKLGEAEAWLGGRLVTSHDLRHFPILLAKTLVRVAPPQVSLGSWAGLEVEETLSDTRLEQSIVRCSPPTRWFNLCLSYFNLAKVIFHPPTGLSRSQLAFQSLPECSTWSEVGMVC